MASCRPESQAYRKCLKDARSGGSTCTYTAQSLEACRAKHRAAPHVFDGTRVLPNPKCKPLNQKVQRCLKWKKGDQSQCREPIDALRACMAAEDGVVAAPTAGDKIWADYKGPR